MTNAKRFSGFIAIVVLANCWIHSSWGAEAKTYVAAGNILRLNSSMLLLRTTSNDLEVTRDAKTKVNGPLTIGEFARVIYERVQGQAHALEITTGDAARAQIGAAAAKQK